MSYYTVIVLCALLQFSDCFYQIYACLNRCLQVSTMHLCRLKTVYSMGLIM